MIISSGWCKGLKLQTPEGLDTRPTRSRVRAAALNMIQTEIEGATVLDLFAGSGAVGFELLSRHAAKVTFVESAPIAIRTLKSNAVAMMNRAESQSRVSPELQILQRDILKFTGSWSTATFTIVWADPPYELVTSFVSNAVWLKDIVALDGLFILESAAKDQRDLEGVFENFEVNGIFELIKRRDYGVTQISIWRRLK